MLQALNMLGWKVNFFFPHISATADIEALWGVREKPDALWVPCFRQRDYQAARRFAKLRKIPLIFDPLISAYDKRVFEFEKVKVNSSKARKLKDWETRMFSSADVVLADTTAHKSFFEQDLGASPKRCFVVPVGAEQNIFRPQPFHPLSNPPEILFYGSFLPLHGPETIIEAARLCPTAHWTLIGNGSLRKACEIQAEGLSNLSIESPIPYSELPDRIGQADILLGIFGTTPKAGRVIPNKVFQALSCGRPIVTRSSNVYPPESLEKNSGLICVAPGDSKALANVVTRLLASEENLKRFGHNALQTFDSCFSFDQITRALKHALSSLDFNIH